MNRRTAALLFVALALALAGCGRLQAPRPAGPIPQEEFRRQVLGARLDDVREQLGPPDYVFGNRWVYEKRTKGPDGRVDLSVTLDTRGDRVVDVAFEGADLSEQLREFRKVQQEPIFKREPR
jgi:hypothetical protein